MTLTGPKAIRSRRARVATGRRPWFVLWSVVRAVLVGGVVTGAALAVQIHVLRVGRPLHTALLLGYLALLGVLFERTIPPDR